MCQFCVMGEEIAEQLGAQMGPAEALTLTLAQARSLICAATDDAASADEVCVNWTKSLRHMVASTAGGEASERVH